MKAKILLTGILLPVTIFVMGQTKVDTVMSKTDSLKDNLQKFVKTTDNTFRGALVSERTFNLFLQKKSSYYLSGVSDVSISKLYATYSSEEDKFNFGVNFPVKNKEERLRWIFSPTVESNIKESFTSLYEDGKWQSDIRIGGKVS